MGQIIVDELGRAITADNRFPVDVGADSNPLAVQLSGSNLVEQLTEQDISTGDLTFAAPIVAVEIVNLDVVNTGVFVVNGVSIMVPPSTIFGPAAVSGTPSAVVAVTGTTACIVSRYQ